MLSKQDSRKKFAGRSSANGKFLSDLETMSEAFYVDKTLQRLATPTASSRSKSVGKLQLQEPKKKPESDAKNNYTKASLDKDKKSSIWSWKGLKALTHVRNHRFNCCFSLMVHSIEGLPAFFNNVCLVVHWKKRGAEQMTRPIRVSRGVAEFDEQLTHSCSVYGSRSGPHLSAKYEAKHFLLYVSVYDSPELDLGKHRIDLTRLLPLKLEELEEEKSSGKWTTSFKLSGKARGATMNVSFGYVVTETDNSTEMSCEKNVSDNVSSQQNSERTTKVDGQSIYRARSVPSGPSTTYQLADDVKDLHEVLPVPKRSELCDSVNILYQKLDEEISNISVEKEVQSDSLSSPVDPHRVELSTPPAGEIIFETKCALTEFSVIDKGIVELAKENESFENAQSQGLGDGVEAGFVGKVSLDEEASLHDSAFPQNDEKSESTCNYENRENEVWSKESQTIELNAALCCTSDLVNEVDSQNDEQPESTCNYETQEDKMCSKESLMKELDAALTCTSDLVNEVDSQTDEQSENTCNYEEREYKRCSKESLMKEIDAALTCTSDLVDEEVDYQEDETDAINPESHLEIESSYIDCRKGKSLSLDDVTESVARDFLEMLGIDDSPISLSSESEPESPRERLLREFEKDALANGGFLNFGSDDDPAELVNDIQMGSFFGATSEDFQHPLVFEDFMEMPNIEKDAFRTKTRASTMEDLETESLMREWGLNEKAFQHSPPSGSGGFGSPIDIPPEDPQPLPPLAEGFGPFVQTQNGGFVRSMNPALFRNAKNAGSLIMQVSNPVVVPAEMGSGVMDILEGLASVGIEKLSMQANKLMPLADVTGKTIQQIAWEGGAQILEGPERQDFLLQESETFQSIRNEQKCEKGISHVPKSSKSDSSSLSSDAEYVSLEDLAPLAMDKIEALSIEGLRIQSGMSNEDAPSNISAQSVGEFSALKGKSVNVGGSIGLDGTCGLQLLDIKDDGEDVDGLMGLSLTLDEWMKLDSGEIDEDELVSERTSKILAAHHATSLDVFRGRSKGEKRRGRSRKYGLLGNNFTVALMVQLRDPLRNFEAVGAPMLALIQVERVFVPPKPKIYNTVSMIRKKSKEDEEAFNNGAKKENAIEKQKEDKINEEELIISQYKITEVNVAGLKMEEGRKKLWGSTNQQQSGSRWLLANGMGKKNNKNPLLKSKGVGKSTCGPVTAKVEAGDSLWSISSRVGAKLKELAGLSPHIRNPNVILPNETIRQR